MGHSEGLSRVPTRLVPALAFALIVGIGSISLAYGGIQQNVFSLSSKGRVKPGSLQVAWRRLSAITQISETYRDIGGDGIPSWVPGGKRRSIKEKTLPRKQDQGDARVPEDPRSEIFECDRSSPRTNICTLKGDVEVETQSNSFKLFAKNPGTPRGKMTVRPHPRKQFSHALDSVSPLTLLSVDSESISDPFKDLQLQCTAVHAATGIVFSLKGHTGNYYHDMNDGWIPLFITLYPYHRNVILILSDPAQWWLDKYASLIFSLTKYPVITLSSEENELHCFREVQLGLQTHGDLMVDPKRTFGHFKMESFGQRWARTLGLSPLPAARVSGPVAKEKPLRLGWVHRAEFDRVLLNEPEILEIAERVGFEIVYINRFKSMREMFELIRSLDVLLGVHGSGLSNFIFMRGNTVLIQITPFELEWFSDNSFGYGSQYHVHYLNPFLSWEESSLSKEYSKDSEVYTDGKRISQEDYPRWCKLYLQANVTWHPKKAESTLQEAKEWLITPGNEVVCDAYDCPMQGAELPAYRAALKAGKKPEPKGLRPPDKAGEQEPDARRRLLEQHMDEHSRLL